MSDITTRTIIRARQDLEDRYGRAPTAGEIATHLKATKGEILKLLRELQRKRIVKERKRRAERVWTRWGEQ